MLQDFLGGWGGVSLGVKYFDKFCLGLKSDIQRGVVPLGLKFRGEGICTYLI